MALVGYCIISCKVSRRSVRWIPVVSPVNRLIEYLITGVNELELETAKLY